MGMGNDDATSGYGEWGFSFGRFVYMCNRGSAFSSERADFQIVTVAGPFGRSTLSDYVRLSTDTGGAWKLMQKAFQSLEALSLFCIMYLYRVLACSSLGHHHHCGGSFFSSPQFVQT